MKRPAKLPLLEIKQSLRSPRVRLGAGLKKAAQFLKNGGVVIFPTDTVYGIGCRFDDKRAVKRIYQIKRTPKSQPFPILVSNIKQVDKIVKVNNIAKELIKKYWPGGLTIILPSRHPKSRVYRGAKDLTAAAKIGIRMPNSDLTRLLIDQVQVPIIATSANFHGQPTPNSYGELDPKLIKLVDYVIKGDCKYQQESTVVDATVDPPKVLRHGAVKL